MTVTEGDLLWQPSDEMKRNSNLRAYMDWLAREKGLHFEDYGPLWQWSVTNIEDFWESLWQYFNIESHQPYTRVLAQRTMPGATWFEGATLNYAEHVLRNGIGREDEPAILFASETQPPISNLQFLSWHELAQQVAAIASALRKMGVSKGDCVAAYIPNMPQAVVAMLACASIGAVWSSCSPDIGASSVLDRFKQIEPKVLFAVDGYIYNGKPFDRREVVSELVHELTSLEHLVNVPYLLKPEAQIQPHEVSSFLWPNLISNLQSPISPPLFEPVSFDHPLWVLYSSGTTGLPKPIVQSQGGILMEHLKAIAFHCDLKPGDRFFWFTTTGWMMWNFLVGGLLQGCTLVLFDGSPGREDMRVLWRLAQDARVNFFGVSAAYIAACMKAGEGKFEPAQEFDLSALKSIGSTGSPLALDGFAWVYEKVKPNVWLNPLSGGTDVCTAFVGGNPLWPVHAGEMQCRYLGAAVEAFDERGQPLHVDTRDVGEFVITQPMPSMPIYFWNDAGMQRYKESYFEMFPGVWRHGDWVKITPHDGVIIYGRSDSTINKQGVRMGTSEYYRVVESTPEVLDSLVIDLEMLGRESYLPLFVVLRQGCALTDALKAQIKQKLRAALSPRLVPDEIFVIGEVPRTLNGKKMEVPIKKILLGQPIEKAVNIGSMANPQTLDYFVEFAKRNDHG
jgi:acetoacetyl-CoA synthetase